MNNKQTSSSALPKKIQENNLAYIAGFLDNSSPFWFILSKRPNGKFKLKVEVRISSQDRYAIDMIRHFFGGNILKRKSGYLLRMGNLLTLSFCKEIYKYLFIHKDLCAEIIDILEDKRASSTGPGNTKTNYLNESYYERLKSLSLWRAAQEYSSAHLNNDLMNYYVAGLFDRKSEIYAWINQDKIKTKISMSSDNISIVNIFNLFLNIKDKEYRKSNNCYVLEFLRAEQISQVINKLKDYSFKNREKLKVLKYFADMKTAKITLSDNELIDIKIFSKENRKKEEESFEFFICESCKTAKAKKDFDFSADNSCRKYKCLNCKQNNRISRQ